MSKTLSIRLSEDLSRQVEEIGKDEDLSASEIIRESLQRWLKVRKFRKLRGEGLLYASRRGLFTDEQVFELIS